MHFPGSDEPITILPRIRWAPKATCVLIHTPCSCRTKHSSFLKHQRVRTEKARFCLQQPVTVGIERRRRPQCPSIDLFLPGAAEFPVLCLESSWYTITTMGCASERPNHIELEPDLVAGFARTFIPRFDRYPLQLSSGSYVTVEEPLSMPMIEAHIRGRRTIGAYALDAQSMAKWICFDADDGLSWYGLRELHVHLATSIYRRILNHPGEAATCGCFSSHFLAKTPGAWANTYWPSTTYQTWSCTQNKMSYEPAPVRWCAFHWVFTARAGGDTPSFPHRASRWPPPSRSRDIALPPPAAAPPRWVLQCGGACRNHSLSPPLPDPRDPN
jgi:hypothetical protein